MKFITVQFDKDEQPRNIRTGNPFSKKKLPVVWEGDTEYMVAAPTGCPRLNDEREDYLSLDELRALADISFPTNGFGFFINKNSYRGKAVTRF